MAASVDGNLVALRDLTDLRWVLAELWEAGGKGGLFVWTRDGVRHATGLDLVPSPPPAHP